MGTVLGAVRARRSALLGAAAIAALAGVGTQVNAATLYVASEGNNEVYQYPNAAYGGTVSATTAANNFASLNAPSTVTVDPSGNIVAENFSTTTGTAHSYSSAGSPLATSSAFGNDNWNGVVYGNSLYTSMYAPTSLSPTAYAGMVVTPYTYSAGSANFGSPSTTITTNSSFTGHVVAMALAPSNQSIGNTTNKRSPHGQCPQPYQQQGRLGLIHGRRQSTNVWPGIRSP
jgi:hypothetical protein